MAITLPKELPAYPTFIEGIRRAPDRGYRLTPAQTETALRNALRYIPKELHAQLAPEFMEELRTRGKIYGYRFRPEGDLKAKPIDEYQGNCIEGKAFQVMIDNNLSFDIALYPYELVTYGETGQVCQNWMQYRLIKKYLESVALKVCLCCKSNSRIKSTRFFTLCRKLRNTNHFIGSLFQLLNCCHILRINKRWCCNSNRRTCHIRCCFVCN